MQAYNLLEQTIENTNKRIATLNTFKEKINNQKQIILEEISGVQFSPSSFDFSLITEEDIENLYEIANKKIINNGNENQKLSTYYTNFYHQDDLSLLEKDCEELGNNIFDYHLKEVSVRDVLQNNVSFIKRKLNSKIEIQKIYNSSRPLLDTKKSHITPGVPFISDILIGESNEDINEIFRSQSFSFSTNRHLNENDKKILGVMTIKSNILAHLLLNTSENENYLRKNLKKNETEKYFTNEKVNEIQLSNVKKTWTTDNQQLKQDLFQFLLLLISDIIAYNKDEDRFESDGFILGNNVRETFGFLNSPNAYEIKEKLNEFNDEIVDLSDNRKKNFVDKTILLIEQNKVWFTRNMLIFSKDFIFETFEASDEQLNRLDNIIKN